MGLLKIAGDRQDIHGPVGRERRLPEAEDDLVAEGVLRLKVHICNQNGQLALVLLSGTAARVAEFHRRV